MTQTRPTLPEVVSRDQRPAARKELLAKEKELTRPRDALNAQRRTQPMVRIDRKYVFDGPAVKAGGGWREDLFARPPRAQFEYRHT